MKVVIVGGGFGGVRAALLLANKKGIEVTLISPRSYFEYHAALYRSATGRSPLEVAIPLRNFFAYARNIEVVEDTIVGIDHKNKLVLGESDSKYTYSHLILALGTVTEFYGIKGLGHYSFGVKTVHEALELKRHLHEQLRLAQSDKNYVVVGAGATGVELAAELVAYLKKIYREHKIKHTFSVDLVEAASRPLATMPEDFSSAVERRLKKQGVTTFYNAAVKSETIDNLQLPSGPIHSRTVVWTAGVANNPFFGKFPDIFTLEKSGRVKVDRYLQAAPDIYVIGDSAASPYSGMAQTALHDANFVVGNLLQGMRDQPIVAYQPKKPVYVIPVGPGWAAVLWGNRRIYGRLGWVLRRLADLRLYLTFLPIKKALTTWRYGFVDEEICPICKQ